MFKTDLKKIFQERYYNDKIDTERFTNLIEKIDLMSENEALGWIDKIIFEQGRATKYRKTTHSVVGVGSGALGAAAVYGIRKKIAGAIPKGSLKGSPKAASDFLNHPKLLNKFSAGVTAGATGIWALQRAVRAHFNDCLRDCGTFKINTPARQKCYLLCREKALTSEIDVLQKQKADPEAIKSREAKLMKIKIKLRYHKS